MLRLDMLPLGMLPLGMRNGTEAMITDVTGPQGLLFDSLPECAPARRRARRARAADGVADGSGDGAPAAIPQSERAAPRQFPAAPSIPPASTPPATAAAYDPAALTNPELRTLVQALPDLRLAYLIVEAARELRRRVAPDQEDDESFEPNPSLLRAARLVAGELSGEDI